MRYQENNKDKIEWQIKSRENYLEVTFPPSYRQFLLEKGSAVIDGYQIFGLPPKEEKKGILLPFWPGDPKRGRFLWISRYQQRIVGLCEKKECQYCNLKEREKLENFQGGKLKVSLFLYQSRNREFYIAHLISVPEEIEKIKPKIDVLTATEYLRAKMPDLPKSFIAISALEDRIRNDEKVICLDTKDGFLFEVSLNRGEILPLNQTFEQWIKIRQESSRRFKEAYERVKARRKETEEWRKREFSHLKGGLLPRPQDWHPIVSRVQDYIIGLTALRYNPRYNCLEVDEFYTVDHPYYQEGMAIKNFANLIFVMARDFSGSLDVIFTQERKDKKPSFFRPSRPVPKELVELARKYGVTFAKAKEGKISHQEGVELFFALCELPDEIRAKIEELEIAGYLLKEMIAEVLATQVWSREEAIWLFLNASRPEAILLGSATPEERLYYAEAVNYARSVLLVTRLKQVIMLQMRDGFSPEERSGIQITLEPKETFWIMKGNERFYLPPSWTVDKTKIWIEAREPVVLLSRPRIVAKPDQNITWIKEDIELLLNSEIEAKTRCLLINYEFISRDYNPGFEEIKKLAREVAKKGVYLLFPPARTPIILDEEIGKRMKKARAMREFPLRKGPLKLWVFEIPSYDWDIPSGAPDITRDATALRNASRDAVAFAGYIFKKIDIHRCRRQFAFNCEVVERIALCYPKSKKIAEIQGKESEDVINALRGINALKGKRYHTVTFSYVSPPELPEFLSRLKEETKEALGKVQEGLVFLPVPYKKVKVPVVKLERVAFPFEIPDEIIAKIDSQIDNLLERKEYFSPEVQIKSAHQQIREALKSGVPLAVSWIQPQTFVEAIRDYLEYQEKRKKLFFKERVPSQPAKLRIEYNDGSEGKPFPLFCLKKSFPKPETKDFLEHHSGLVSLRHMETDFFVENYLIRNREIQLRENSAEQEDIAFRKVYQFLETFIKLVRHEVDVREVSKTRKVFLYLWKKLNLEENKKKGVKLHLYLATGLEPATVGGFRAVIEILKKFRGQLIVVPRIFTGRIKEEITPFTSEERVREIREINYFKAKEWF